MFSSGPALLVNIRQARKTYRGATASTPTNFVITSITKNKSFVKLPPDFLHDIILGYGDPGAAHYTKMPNQVSLEAFNRENERILIFFSVDK
jgi:Intron-binding protein aquarius N-terminus